MSECWKARLTGASLDAMEFERLHFVTPGGYHKKISSALKAVFNFVKHFFDKFPGLENIFKRSNVTKMSYFFTIF